MAEQTNETDSIFRPGRVCVKIAGREAGRYCAVLDVIDNNFVVVEGPKVRKRKCNVAHLEPLKEVVDKANAVQEISKKFGVKVSNQNKKS